MRLFPELTEKMEMLLTDIIGMLGQLPPEQKGYVVGLGDELDIEWVHGVACFIALEFVKYSYDYSDPEYSLRHFLTDVNNESDRMLQTRIMKYVLYHKDKEITMKGGSIHDRRKYADTDMGSITKRLKGHHITEMNYFEHQNIHNLEIIKAIVERRIVSAKKISNERFQEMLEQYDRFVESLQKQSQKSDKDMVFASLALFTFEWHFPIETFYYLSCIMEEEGITVVDQDTLLLICGYVDVRSRFGMHVSTESRMVKERMIILRSLFGKEMDAFHQEELVSLIKEILVIVVLFTEAIEDDDGIKYKDWFREESSMEDWASFFRYYNMFSIWEKKEWTNKRIQNMRYLFDSVLGPKR